MDTIDAIKQRRSVRVYNDAAIDPAKRRLLREYIAQCNNESGLNMQIVFDEANCLNALPSRYTDFSGATNYIACVGKCDEKLFEKTGFYGEQIVLYAQSIGLNTCWVGSTYIRSLCSVSPKKGEKLVCIISIGYGDEVKAQRKSRSLTEISNCTDTSPQWFKAGVEAALLAPVSEKNPDVFFTLKGDDVSCHCNNGQFARVDMGIAKCHFSTASGHILAL